MATIRDVAQKAQVSVSTVSLAYCQPHRVSDATRHRIMAAAAELHYRPNGIARDLRTRRTDTIGVLLQHVSGPFYSELISGVEAIGNRLGLSTITARVAPPSHEGATRLLREARVDGAIVLAPAIETSDLLRYASARLPIVVLDRRVPQSAPSNFLSSVTADHRTGGYLVGRHLLAQGFQRFGLIAGPVDSEDSQLRQIGFYQALSESHCDVASVPVVHGDFTEAGGARAMATLLAGSSRLNAIFVENDEMAVGALKVLSDQGFRVPEDVGVIGYDDIPLAQYLNPPLSTVRQPMYELGIAAMKRLHLAMTRSEPVASDILPVTLVPRASTKRHQKAGDCPNVS